MKPLVLSWVSFVCFASAAALQLQTADRTAARCGDNVTLTCDAASPQRLDIKLFSWVGRGQTLCPAGVGTDRARVACDRREAPGPRLTLTLLDVTPADEGRYLCKLHSPQGLKNSATFVSVQDCHGARGSSVHKSVAKCWFAGVYPPGEVHWFDGGANVTRGASTEAREDPQGRYDITSTIDVKEGERLSCRLWAPGTGRYLLSQELHAAGNLESSASSGTPRWICVALEMMVALVFAM